MFVQQVISGIAIGCIYAMVALAFILVYKATEIVNFAQGDMLMLCTFFCYYLITILQISYWPAFVLTLIFSIFLGLLMHLVLRKMFGAHEFSIIIATIAVGIIIRGGIGLLGGTDIYPFPSPFRAEPYNLGWIIINRQFVWIIFITFLLLIVFYYIYNRTTFGTAMRATSQDPTASQLMGINVNVIFGLSWIICSAVGAVAGILIAPITFLFLGIGFVGLKAFPAAVLGGWGNIPGAVVGSLTIGVSENLAGGYLPYGMKDIFAWIILIIVLILKPEGIFGIHRKKKL